MMRSNRSTLLLVISLTLLFIGLVVFAAVRDNRGEDGQAAEDWETYVSDEYDFSIDYPEGWNVTESGKERVEPIITIAKEEGAENGAMPPYDHFVNATYVSILPQGLGTEGLLGQTKETDVDFEVEADRGTDYVLADGSVFATFANIENAPRSWGQAGYIFGRAHIGDLETQCEREGEEVEDVACDIPMEEGAEIAWYGEISEEEYETVEAMLESFRFVEGQAVQSGVE